MNAGPLDGQAVKRIFRMKECHGWQIMAGLAGLGVGNAVALSRRALVAPSVPM